MMFAAWGFSTYALAATGLFAILILLACVADLVRWRHNISDSVLLCILIAFGVFGVVSVASFAFALLSSAFWILFGWW